MSLLNFFKKVPAAAAQVSKSLKRPITTAVSSDSVNKVTSSSSPPKKLKVADGNKADRVAALDSPPVEPVEPAEPAVVSPSRLILAQARMTMADARSSMSQLQAEMQKSQEDSQTIEPEKESEKESEKEKPEKEEPKKEKPEKGKLEKDTAEEEKPEKNPAEKEPEKPVHEHAENVRSFPPTALTLKTGETMFSTNASSAAKRKWLACLTDKGREEGRTYCSSDGSSTGWHSCVYVASGSDRARLRAKWSDHDGTRNVGAEAAGFLLAVETLPDSLECCDVVFLVDFLNALAFDVGSANYKAPLLAKIYGKVNKLKQSLGLVAEKQEKQEKEKKSSPSSNFFGTSKSTKITAAASTTASTAASTTAAAIAAKPRREMRWSRVHHPGHQKDQATCWFTQLNVVADALASLKEDVDVTVKLSVLAEVAVQKGKHVNELVKKILCDKGTGVVGKEAVSNENSDE